MHLRSICLYFFMATLAMPNGTPAQQNPAASDQKPDAKLDKRKEIQADGKTFTPPPPENWASLGDLKTGLLLPPASAIVQRDEQPDFVRELVRVQWRIGDPIDLWICRPRLAPKAPVILYLYSYSDTNARFRDNGWAKRASADGFAAVGFVAALTPDRFANRPMKQWFVSEFPESLGSTVHDVQMILNYLASRGDMDMDHVGMFGMGSGATVAILAARADTRIKTVDLLDPWGDWPDWLKDSPVVPDAERPKYLTPEFLQSVAPFDPVTHLRYLTNPNVRLQQTWSEALTPDAAKAKIAEAAPLRAVVVRYGNPQDLLDSWKTKGLSGWIKEQLRPQTPNGNRTNAAAVSSPSLPPN